MQTMKRAVFFFLSAALFALCARAEVLPSKVYVVANSDDPDSLAIADFYASARGIPKGNIVGLPMPKAGKISKAEYFEKIENPLVAELAKRGALKAVKLGGREPSGREIYSYVSHDIGFLVLCRGVPWGVNPSPNSPAPNPPKSFSDAASVDSEISGRFVSSKSFAGFVKNPLFNNYSWAMTPSITGTIPVARLDGVSRADVEASVRNALEAEKKGVRGRVYIDESKREKTGDKWLSAAGKILSAAGFDVSENTEPRLFGFADRMDAPAFYFGWYAFNPAGYFADKNFKFPAGASALHIFSFSAANMRDRNSWTPAFTAEGASATFGNVYEPYLGGTHYPHVYVLALARGMSAGEAATAAMPFLSWQGVFVGDPMFKPFKTDLKKQMENIDAGEIDELSQYSVIRMVNSISKKGGARAAFDYASKYVGKMPDAALLWKLAQLAAADKNTSASEQLARDALSRDIYSKVSDRGLAFEICAYLIPLSQQSRAAARGSLERLAGLSEDGEYLVAVARLAKELSKREELGGELAGVVKRADAYAAQKAMEREKNAKK
mgnify:FL=1